MSRILATTAVFAVLAAPAAAQPHADTGKQPVNWAQRQIKLVVAHGLMAKSVQAFRPNDTLTRGALSSLIAGLNPTQVGPVTQSAAPVTMAQLDASLVRALARLLPEGFQW